MKLGEKNYFFGDTPTSLDATVYGFLASIVWVPWEGEDKKVLTSYPSLVRFCERVRKEYW